MSTSTDSSVIVWSPSTELGGESVWTMRQRFGDLGGQRLGGFVGGLWAVEDRSALAYGWNGCWRHWCIEGGTENTWKEQIALTGHSDDVKGISWSPTGEYLLSTRSADDKVTFILLKQY